jgi:hypothetical protein
VISGDGIEFWGQSFIAGTSGEILAKASADREEFCWPNWTSPRSMKREPIGHSYETAGSMLTAI